MLIEHLPEGPDIEADVCIVGAGAAGIVLALELMDAGRSVVLLESGGFAKNADTQALCDLETPFLPVKQQSRIRMFGGTTTVWTGGWKPLERDDFETRDWMPFSGWPITLAHLEPYYDRAAKLVGGLTTRDFAEAGAVQMATEFSRGIGESGGLLTTVLWEMPKKKWDFGKVFRDVLEASSSVRVFLNTNVTDIEKRGTGITGLSVKSLEGTGGRVTAGVYVIACGGIENARLLLHSKIGLEHDQVGRYYMDHPKGTVGTIHRPDYAVYAPVTGEHYRAGGRLITGFQLTPRFRSEHRIPNCYVQIRPAYAQHSLARRVARKFLGVPYTVEGMNLRTFIEQVPAPHNRVTLSHIRDAFGNPLPRVEWTLSELDKEGARQLHRQLQVELARAGLGVLESRVLASAEDWPLSSDASHHIGTTRMGYDPKTSVVDANCRVHGVGNLFVAGSSVFPTGGNANPTATILALAVRLCDHLKTLP